MNNASRHRVYLIGAGFSKPCGLPVATELLGMARKHPDLQGLSVALDQQLKSYCRITSTPEDHVGIEEFIDFLSIAAERVRLHQHTSVIGRQFGGPYADADDIENLGDMLSDTATEIIHSLSAQADLQPAVRWVGHVKPGDVIVSFNFDCVIERAAYAAQRPLWNGFGSTRDPSTHAKLLKLHGSVDWYTKPRNEIDFNKALPSGIELLYKKTDCNEDARRSSLLHGAPTGELGESEYDLCLVRAGSIEHARQFFGDYLPEHRLAMPRFGGRKPLHVQPGLGVLWSQAENAFMSSSEIVCIGFSFSNEDLLIRHVIDRALCARRASGLPMPPVVIVDPKADDIAKRVSGLFKESKCCRSSHSCVEWSRMLGTPVNTRVHAVTPSPSHPLTPSGTHS